MPDRNAIYGEFKFYWEDKLWLDYIAREDISAVLADLLDGMDEISHEYIRMHIHLLKLLPYKEHILIDNNYGWTAKDFEDAILAEQLAASSQMKAHEVFIHVNMYGMRDLPQEALASINGTCIVDGGAYIGDTLCLFNNIFPQSRIFAFEPQKTAFEQLKKNIQLFSMRPKTVPLCMGLSNTEEELTLYSGENIDSGATCNALAVHNKVPVGTIKTTTIDAVFKGTESPVGLIKLDIEGLEMKALEGARQTILRHKPVIVAAIYHTPEDFFELKNYIKSMHSDYKFMVRRSEAIIPTADLVLIAY